MALKLDQNARELAERIFREVAEMSPDPEKGISRQGYSETENKVHAYLRNEAEKLGLEVKEDRVGNQFFTLPGKDRSLPVYMTGSHADSVPQGGNYDGLAGVTAALASVAQLIESGITPERDITVAVFRMEESSWFGKAYVGSLALTGNLKAKDLELKHRSGESTLGEAVEKAGFKPEDFIKPEPTIDLSRIAAFTELHIEQGPTLDASKTERVGIVTGIRGNVRHKKIRCVGETAHSGAVNREFRHDAVLASAELLSRMDRHWKEFLERGEDLVFTVGVFHTGTSSSIAIIPGEAAFCLDIRSLHESTLNSFLEVFKAEAKIIEAERGVKFEFDSLLRCAPAELNRDLIDHLKKTADEIGIPAKLLPSGAGHDSAVLTNAGVPSSMIFVANQNGSHNPYEAMKMEDFFQGAEVLLNALAAYR